MPSKQIIITLSNEESDPDGVQMHIDVAQQGEDTTEAEKVLSESAFHICTLFADTLLNNGGQEIAPLTEESDTDGTA